MAKKKTATKDTPIRIHYVRADGTTSCGINEFHGFRWDSESILRDGREAVSSITGKPLVPKMTDADWYGLVSDSIKKYGMGGEIEYSRLTAIILFSGNSEQVKGPESPVNFAKWLRSKGEQVVTLKARNENSGRDIQTWLWKPSDKFRAKLEKINEDRRKIYEKLRKEEEKRYNRKYSPVDRAA